MRNKRCNRKTKSILPIVLIFYCGCVDCSMLPQKGDKFHVESVSDIKNHLKQYHSFNPKKDRVFLYIPHELLGMFEKKVPCYVHIKSIA